MKRNNEINNVINTLHRTPQLPIIVKTAESDTIHRNVLKRKTKVR